MIMKIDSLEKRTEQLEQEISSLYSGVERYKIYSFFKEIKSVLEYRKTKPFVDICEDGHEFRCQRCGVLMQSLNYYYEFEFCPLCGQRVADEGTCKIIEEENGEEDIRST